MAYDVVVMGSINMDLMVHVDTFPEYMQNTVANGLEVQTGGKGSNQAVAVAKQGVSHAFIGAVGNDDFGDRLLAMLAKQGVETSHIIRKADASTGIGVGIVDARGENTFMGVLGANMALTADETTKAFESIDAKVFLLQMETSKESVLAALTGAKGKGMRVILDPAPEGCFFEAALRYADVVTPNRQETERITGIRIDGVESAKQAALAIAAKGVENVIVKMGGEGSVVYETARDAFTVVPAERVNAINTTGAGDTFAGVLAACLARDPKDLIDAVRMATRAAALKVSRPGGQDAIPTWRELQNAAIGE